MIVAEICVNRCLKSEDAIHRLRQDTAPIYLGCYENFAEASALVEYIIKTRLNVIKYGKSSKHMSAVMLKSA